MRMDERAESYIIMVTLTEKGGRKKGDSSLNYS